MDDGRGYFVRLVVARDFEGLKKTGYFLILLVKSRLVDVAEYARLTAALNDTIKTSTGNVYGPCQ